MTDAEALYPREATGRFFTISLAAHAVVAALLLIGGLFSATDRFGAEHASSGSVGVNAVSSIPIPKRQGPQNPLAHDTQSTVPTLVEKVRPQAKAVEPDAIPIPSRVEKKKRAPHPPAPTAYQPPKPYKANQLYSHAEQATTSPMYGMKGAGGIDIGPQSVLGTRFGAYADLIRELVAQRWNTASVNAAPSQKCGVTFTIARDGSVSNVKVADPSGNYLLDTSAKRAVMDASPLPALPREFPRNDATVEFWFQVQK